MAKRLKALLKATIRLVRFVFQDTTLCVVDHWFEGLSSVRDHGVADKVFGAYAPFLPEVYCNDKVHQAG